MIGHIEIANHQVFEEDSKKKDKGQCQQTNALNKEIILGTE